MNPVCRFEHLLVRGYRRVSSGRLSPCRFTPSCSAYALESLQSHGFLRANRLIIGRLLRCQPWGGWGADPVPPATSK